MIKITPLTILLLLFILCISCSDETTEEETPDTTPPTVSFSIKGIVPDTAEEPPIVGNTIEIEINAQDAKGISKVEAFLDNAKVGEDRDAPFKITIDLTQLTNKLSGKGTAVSDTQTLYILKVTATDLVGNVSTIEQEVIVDNEMPIINEVSLKSNTGLKGEENQVTFKAYDNEEITSLEVKINETVIEPTVLDSIYTFNIDTSVLEDGQNNLSIRASDEATNVAIYNAPFIADNTGPEITFEGLPLDSIVDESTLFTIIAEDLYSEVDSLKISVNDSIISKSANSNMNLEFNPDDYPTGDVIFKINAIDSLGNKSTEEVNFGIKRLLVKISVPSDFLDPYITKFYVFASDSSGEVLAVEPLEFNTSFIKLNTLTDISSDTEYMLNFAYLYSGAGETSIIKTIQNVKRSTLDNINLQIPKRKNVSGQNSYLMSTMPNDINILSEGSDYSSNYIPGTEFYIEDYSLSNTEVSSNQYYVYYHNAVNNTYGAQIIDKPVNADFSLAYSSFSTDGIETKYFNSSSIQDPNKSTFLKLYGYLNEADFEDDVYHRLWDTGYQNASILAGPGYRYAFNTGLYNYRYEITAENYRVEGYGQPLENYNAPDWSIDYTYSSAEKKFSLNKTGTTHTTGKIRMDLVDTGSYYTWTVLFDSQTSDEVILPKLPEELQTWNINNYYATGDLNIDQIEVKGYEGLNDYDAYLQKVVKNNIHQQHKTSNKIETIYKSNIEAYIESPDFSFIR